VTNEELTQKYVDLDERVTRHTEQIKTAFNRIDDVKNLADSVHKLAVSVEVLTREQQSSNTKMDELAADVEEIKGRPAKKWDNVASTLLTVIITAVITFILAKIGIN
jgi:predicted  nucleic acid-binding Zn-ribbon protein